MAERGSFRGRGRGGGYARGGSAQQKAGAGGGAGGGAQERPKKENILDLSKYMDKTVSVKFNGGREGEFSISVLDKKGELLADDYQPREPSKATTSS